MALMYANAQGDLLGLLNGASFDADIGDGNDFALMMSKNNFGVLGDGYIVFDSENTEFGGVIDSIEADTASSSVVFSGATWLGILDKKVIRPPDGQAYLTVTGSTAYIIGSLVSSLGLSSLFFVDGYDADSPGTGGSFTFNRYITLLEGITDLLDSRSLVLSAKYNVQAKKVTLTAREPTDYSVRKNLIESDFNYKVKKPFKPVNHLICLGKGELQERTVIDLYADEAGNLSGTQTLTGTDEVASIYENTSADSAQDLERLGRKKFNELIRPSIEISVAKGINYRIGDIIGGYEPMTKIQAKAKISSLILQIDGDDKTISYKTQR